MTPLASLARSVMLGTERAAVELPSAVGDTARALDAVSALDAPAEERVLLTAAILGPYEEAGKVSGELRSDELPEASPSDERQSCSDFAANLLRRVLTQYPELLSEWLELAEAKGVIAQPSVLPSLLDAGKNSKDVRPRLLGVLGRRGRWLAKQNPAWSYVGELMPNGLPTERAADASEPDRTPWDEGTLAERAAFLLELRRNSPQTGRELLEEVWTSENAATRESLLDTLHQGLGMADEPFLESCLADRSKKVRTLAAEQLGKLPDSRRGQRMRARAAAAFRLERKLLRRTLVVEEPDEWDEAALADGLTEGNAKGLGPAAWRIRELVSATPISFWSEDLGLSFEDLASQVGRSTWRHALSLGLTVVARRHQERFLARALVNVLVNDETQSSDLRALVRLLPPAELDAWMVRKVSKGTSLSDLVVVISDWSPDECRTWSPEISRAVHVKARQLMLRSESGDVWRLSQLLPRIGLHLHSDVIEEAIRHWPEDLAPTPRTQEEVGKFQIVLALRQQMREEFTS